MSGCASARPGELALLSPAIREICHEQPTRDGQAALLGSGVVVEADGPGNLPRTIVVLPQCHELRFTHILSVSGVVEAMDAEFYRAIVGYRINL